MEDRALDERDLDDRDLDDRDLDERDLDERDLDERDLDDGTDRPREAATLVLRTPWLACCIGEAIALGRPDHNPAKVAFKQ